VVLREVDQHVGAVIGGAVIGGADTEEVLPPMVMAWGGMVVGAKLAAFVGLTEVLFATLFAWLLLAQTPTVPQAVGGLFVPGGITLVRLDEHPPSAGPA
jgi:drug/metabolite transporter (DMT)-like permease